MTIAIVILSVIIVILIASYFLEQKLPGFNRYTIKKGKHYSLKNSNIIPYKVELCRKSIGFDVIFGRGCDYDSIAVGDSINKLYGISYGFDNQYRSARVGWRYNSNLQVIELFSYCHIKGKVIYNHITNVKLFDVIRISIVQGVTDVVKFEVGEERYYVQIEHSPIHFKQFPYFGGKKTAPQDMEIFIKEV